MILQEYAKQLKEVLALDGTPVGVAFSDSSASNGKGSKVMACSAFYQAARKGVTFNVSAETSTFPGGFRRVETPPKTARAFMYQGF
ncbi:DUF169 domain-containing protein [Desulfosporosinus sp. Sb-LF]|uniref:DUF169 domain-containing protein n=1 Tax=Desulfosporosinus sp. Sb-LF TaxID=2560027 RepID=UPI00107F00D0|nr:DUF169 domain-containing protein [Desulfosporosinus sp. Sb-LF]TGE31062.1 hypothetical protein E4K68_19030 [Desulfosporosinus sp. Sb-LF]